MTNQLTTMARELLTIEEDLPYRWVYNGKCRPTPDDFTLYVFEQEWGSTALGFDGFGGQAFTTGRTYVFVPKHLKNTEQKCIVYFNNTFAYAVDYSNIFMYDVRKQCMKPIYESHEYDLEN